MLPGSCSVWDGTVAGSLTGATWAKSFGTSQTKRIRQSFSRCADTSTQGMTQSAAPALYCKQSRDRKGASNEKPETRNEKRQYDQISCSSISDIDDVRSASGVSSAQVLGRRCRVQGLDPPILWGLEFVDHG